MIKQIKQILGNIKVHIDGNNNEQERNILSAISFNRVTDEQIEAHIAKQIENGKTTEDKIIAVARQAVKVANRTLHSFDTLDEINKFKSENECGQMWDENDKWNVYKY